MSRAGGKGGRVNSCRMVTKGLEDLQRFSLDVINRGEQGILLPQINVNSV